MTRRQSIPLSFLVMTALASLMMSGCTLAPRYGPIPNPFSRHKPELEQKYGPTPAQRAAQIREIGEAATQMSPTEQERHSFDLSQKYQAEADSVLRAEIVGALAAFPTRAASSALHVALADDDPRVRLAAVDAWGRRGGQDALDALGKVVAKDKDIDVQLAAIRVLGNFQGPYAAQALLAGLDHSNPAMQHRAVQSLQAVSGQDYGADREAWRRYAMGSPPGGGRPERSWASRLLPNSR